MPDHAKTCLQSRWARTSPSCKTAIDQKRSAADPAVAVVFTKSDTSPEAELAPDRFAANNMPRLVDFCQRNFRAHKFFAASVVGSSCMIGGNDVSGYQQIPLHIEPRGVIEPLQWVIGQC